MKIEDEIKTSKFKSDFHRASINLLYTANWLKERINEQLKPFGLKNEQYNVMRILRGKNPEPMCVKDIGSRMIFKNSNVPRILERLEGKKLIVRLQSDSDKRESLSKLTDQGLSILKSIDDVLNKTENNFLNLSLDEASNFNSLLDKCRG